MAQVLRAGGAERSSAEMPGWVEVFPLPAVVLVGDEVVAANERALALGSSCRVDVPFSEWFERGSVELVEGARSGGRSGPVARLAGRERWVALHVGERDGSDQQVVVLRDVTDEEFARAALDAVADSTFVLDGGGRPRWRSDQLRRRSGIPDDQAAQQNPSERIHPEDLPVVLNTFVDSTPVSPSKVVVRSRAVDDDDHWETIEIVVHQRLDHDVLAGYLVQVHNLDSGVKLVDGLDAADPEWQSLTEAAPVGIVVTDIVGEVVYRNRAARELLGRDVQWLGRDSRWLDLARAEDRARLKAAFDVAIKDGEASAVTAGFYDGSGELRWLRLVTKPQRSADQNGRGLIATLEDVTEQVEARDQLDAAEAQLRHLATHDPLTELPNRARLTDRLAEALRRHDREHLGLAVLFCDLDGFKPINDRHGHAAGDRVLVEVASRLEAAAASDGFVARIGGDEFVVLHEGLDDGVAVEALAARLHAALSQPFEVEGQPARLATSIGIATLAPGVMATADTLLRIADQAMYEAKDAGPGRTATTAVRADPTS